MFTSETFLVDLFPCPNYPAELVKTDHRFGKQSPATSAVYEEYSDLRIRCVCLDFVIGLAQITD